MNSESGGVAWKVPRVSVLLTIRHANKKLKNKIKKVIYHKKI